MLYYFSKMVSADPKTTPMGKFTVSSRCCYYRIINRIIFIRERINVQIIKSIVDRIY